MMLKSRKGTEIPQYALFSLHNGRLFFHKGRLFGNKAGLFGEKGTLLEGRKWSKSAVRVP